jgi:hypothetical protein
MGSRMHIGQIPYESRLSYQDDIRGYIKCCAEALDTQDPLRHFRHEFLIPSKTDLKRKGLPDSNITLHIELLSKTQLIKPKTIQLAMESRKKTQNAVYTSAAIPWASSLGGLQSWSTSISRLGL